MVARMKGGVGIGRCLDPKSRGQRVKISVGRNRAAELPGDRVVLATGIAVEGEEEVEEFRRRCEALASEIDLSEVWEIVRDEAAPMSLEDLAELYWGPTHQVAQRVALLLYLDRTSLYFVGNNGGYTARSEEYVRDIQARRNREAENARESASLMEYLSQRRLPPQISPYQTSLLEHLRGYAIHGENYTRSATVRSLLDQVESGTRDHQRLGFELLVDAGIFSPDEPLELERAEIVEDFSEDALAEAAALDRLRALDEPQRRDLTPIPSITIDDAGAADRDDALSLEVETPDVGPGDRASAAGVSDRGTEVPGPVALGESEAIYRIGVHIADAGALISPGGALDQEADRRMATLYLPERRVPMLPPEASDRAGSLVPGERRAALSLLVRFTESGELLDWEATPSVVRSQAALSYEEADRAMGAADDPWHPMLAPLDRMARSLRRKREEAGAVTVERPEMTIKVTSAGEVEVRVVPRSAPARQMVAEFMILCNSLLAEFCRRHDLPAAYRSQAAPDLTDLTAELPEGPLRRFLVMRRFAPADLDIVPAAHGGLGVAAYIQATSPLRRYPDLVMQRQISHFMRSGQPLYTPEIIASVAQRAEVQLKELRRLEEDRKRYWFLKFLKQSVSPSEGDDETGRFEAVILENQPGRPALLELTDYPFRFRAALPESCDPGETVTMRLRGVDLWYRVPQFVHDERSTR